MFKIRTTIFGWLIIPLIVLIYWQVSFFTASLKWDFLDVIFPFRYYFSSSVLAGHFPLWNPYIQTGYPFYADLQAPTFSPELLLVSSLGGYNIYWLHILFVAYLVIACFGIHKLIEYFGYSSFSGYISGIIYVCSGYFIGHGQHLFLIIGGAWLPWVVWSYFKFSDSQNNKTSIALIVFLFLTLSGSYQSLSICLVYLLLTIFILNLLKLIFQDNKKLLSFFIWHVLVGIVVLFLISPIVISTLEISDEVERLSRGVSWEKTAKYGQSFNSLLSLISPLSVAKSNAIFGEIDPSMLNWFIGSGGLLFFIFGIRYRKSRYEWVLLLIGLLIGCMSFEILPIRKLMFDNVPLMNLFLQGPYLRIFLIFGIIPIIAAGIEKSLIFSRLLAKDLIISLSVLCFLFASVGLCYASFDFKDIHELWLNKANWFDGWKNLKLKTIVGFQLIFGLLFLSPLIYSIVRIKRIEQKKTWITAIILLELFLVTQWNQSESVVDRNYSPIDTNKSLEICPKGFPIPNMIPIGINDEQHAFISPLWRNTYIFQKQISFNGFSSFRLNNYDFLDNKNPFLKDFILKKPLFYLCDTIAPLTDINKIILTDSSLNNAAFFDFKEFKLLKNYSFAANINDSLKITGFSPNEAELIVKTKHKQLLIFNQSFHPNWNAKIDGKNVQIFRVNKNYQAILIPTGLHKVIFYFSKNIIVFLYLLTQFVFLLLAFTLVFNTFNLDFRSKNIRIFYLIPIIYVGFWAFKLSNGKLFTIDANDQIDLEWKQKNILKSNYSAKQVEITPNVEFYNFWTEKIKADQKPEFLRLKLDCKMSDINSTIIFLEIKRSGKLIKWEATKLERQLENRAQWNKILFIRNLPQIKANDEINVFLWNLNKSSIKLKNIQVALLN